jgi:hypothetical protein
MNYFGTTTEDRNAKIALGSGTILTILLVYLLFFKI